MYQDLLKKIKPIHIAIFLVVIVLIILTVLSITKITSPPKVNISSGDDKKLEQVPKKTMEELSAILYVAVKNHAEKEESIPKNAEVRKDSATTEYNQRTEMYYGNFIVDIPSIRQSYLINFTWPHSEYDPNLLGSNLYDVSCVPPNRAIYKDFNCIDSEEQLADKALFYLPYELLTPSGRLLSIYGDIKDSKLQIQLISPVCGSKEREEEVLQTAENWFYEHKLDLSQYDHTIINSCTSANAN